jgi:shikimate dehydrogenase
LHKYGLIGYPLGHSFSVPYFKEKFEKEGIDAVYQNYPLVAISEFENLVQKEPELMGLNVTVPYKQQILKYLDALNDTARTIQAVNTICFCRKEKHLALVGHNTDVIGFERSLKEHIQEHHTAALVLGTGGSSKAVTFVLDKLGISFQMVSRSRGEDRLSYEDLNEEMVDMNPLIINTTPMGMHPDIYTYPPIPYKALTTAHLLFDLVYNPPKTQFLVRGEEHGARGVNGYDMLVYQAEGSWELWSRQLEENEP